jgi:FkbM family methyltransferase
VEEMIKHKHLNIAAFKCFKQHKAMRHDMRQLTHELRDRIKVNTFVEIGSRDGHDAHHVCQYWNLNPANCYIIEAHPVCYANIIQAYPQYNTINVAASDVTGTVEFNAGIVGQEANVGISSVLTRTLNDTFISEKVKVNAVRMDELMRTLTVHGFDLAKIDVEGFAMQVLKGFGDKLRRFKALQLELEIQEVWEGQSLHQDVVEYLKGFGFRVLDEVQLCAYQKDVLFINDHPEPEPHPVATD